ncbi:MAG: hypothetical protein Q8R12_04145 [bacterium]|nr:hypothetical protein [bacterium]
MEILDKLFGSGARVKIMRFFLTNPYDVFTIEDVSRTLRLSKSKVRREIKPLFSMKFLRKGMKETEIISGRTKRLKKRKEPGFAFNNIFPYARELKALLVESLSVSRELLIKRFRRLGRGLKLVLLSGLFTQRPGEGRLDILVVGDNIRKAELEKILGKIEAEIGRELQYASLSTAEFQYRQGMYDKFVRDILESEHDVLIDNLNSS